MTPLETIAAVCGVAFLIAVGLLTIGALVAPKHDDVPRAERRQLRDEGWPLSSAPSLARRDDAQQGGAA